MENLFGIRQPSYVVKVTGDCNLSCQYCYYFDLVKKQSGSRLEWKLIESLVEQSSKISKVVEFIWHGGEPLIPGIDFYQRIFDLQKLYRDQKGITFKNKIQTNATLINTKWVEFFINNNVGIGVSLDGPQWLHDGKRVNVTGKGSFLNTIKGVRLLQESNIEFAILAVLTKESINLADDIFRFFVTNGIKKFDFLPYVEIDDKNERQTLRQGSLLQGEYSKFMNRIFDLWLEYDDPTISIRSLEEMISGMLGQTPLLCSLNDSCIDFITINYDGNVSACDNLMGFKEFDFGNLKYDSLDGILYGEKRSNFKKNLLTKKQSCSNCSFLSACGGGCTKYAFIFSENLTGKNYFCYDRKEIYKHISLNLKREHPALVMIAQ